MGRRVSTFVSGMPQLAVQESRMLIGNSIPTFAQLAIRTCALHIHVISVQPDAYTFLSKDHQCQGKMSVKVGVR